MRWHVGNTVLAFGSPGHAPPIAVLRIRWNGAGHSSGASASAVMAAASVTLVAASAHAVVRALADAKAAPPRGEGAAAPPPGGYGGYPPQQGYPTPPPQMQQQQQRRSSNPAQLVNQSVKVNVERFIDDFASMGFTRDQVRGVIRDLSDSGQTVDTNVVLDRLMNGRR